MANGDSIQRRPFGPRDARTLEQRLLDATRAARQRDDFTRLACDDEEQRRITRLFQSRRETQTDWQIDVVPLKRGGEVMAVRGELLVRADSFPRDVFEKLRTSHQFEFEPIECLDNRVIRITGPQGRAELDRLADVLRTRGIPASLSYVVPMGPLMKGLGGPDPSEGPPPELDQVTTRSVVTVAVLDTGIAEAKRNDGWLADIERNTHNIDPLNVLPNPPDEFLDMGAGHGTFTAGVIQQVAPGARIVVERVLDSDGVGREWEVACAMVQAARNGADIINLSLGVETVDDEPPVALEVALEMITEIEHEQQREIAVVAAAGNYAHDRPCWPAAFRRVIAVAGLTSDLRGAAWSSRGFWVDVSTRAEGVRSTFVEGTEWPVEGFPQDSYGPDSWALWTGTSFAAPQVSGAIAHLALTRGLPPRQAFATLLREHRVRRVRGFGWALDILDTVG